MELWEKLLFGFCFLFLTPVALVWGIVWAVAGRADEHRYWGRVGAVAAGTYIFVAWVYLLHIVPDTTIWPVYIGLVGVLTLVIMVIHHRKATRRER